MKIRRPRPYILITWISFFCLALLGFGLSLFDLPGTQPIIVVGACGFVGLGLYIFFAIPRTDSRNSR
jgi:hypothetical protein